MGYKWSNVLGYLSRTTTTIVSNVTVCAILQNVSLARREDTYVTKLLADHSCQPNFRRLSSSPWGLNSIPTALLNLGVSLGERVNVLLLANSRVYTRYKESCKAMFNTSIIFKYGSDRYHGSQSMEWIGQCFNVVLYHVPFGVVTQI